MPKFELVFTPITPCRVFSAAGATPANQVKTYQITGNGNLTSQGGPNGGCGVPTYATAVFVSLTGGLSTAPGAMKAYASGTPQPGAVSLRYRANENATTGAIVSLNALGKVDVVATTAAKATGDVTGYYAPQIEGLVSQDGSIYSGSPGILSSVRNSAGNFTVTVDRDVTYCTPIVSPYVGSGIYANAYAFNGDKVTVYMWRLDSTATPVGLDGYFYLAVHC